MLPLEISVATVTTLALGLLIGGGVTWLFPATWRSRGTRQNGFIVLVLMVSVYLGIAAIVAVPELRSTDSTESTEITADQLKTHLDEALISEESLSIAFPLQPFSADPIQAYLDVAAAKVKQLSTRGSRAVGIETWQQLMAELTPAEQLRRQRVGDYQAMRQFLLTQQRDAEAAAISEFRVNADRKGMRERGRHFLALEHWFRGRQSLVLWTRLRPCLGALREMEGIWETWAANQTLIATRTTMRRQSIGADSLRPPFADNSVLKPLVEARALCGGGPHHILPDSLAEPPARPPLGADLGPFSIIAQWLVRTESLPLALITGMLGFGLLGATVSTALHEQASTGIAGKTKDEPIVEDLTGVFLRGFSAAIVVFLAVEGGLAIFGSSGAEPNPYVLLLTCLVAAAFSHEVWEYAHQVLRERLGTKGTSAVIVSPDKAIVLVGKSVTLTARVADASGAPVANAIPAWSSSDAAIAAVDVTTGVVTGVAPGVATITAKADGIGAGTAGITVK